jgi:hypothetical protein
MAEVILQKGDGDQGFAGAGVWWKGPLRRPAGARLSGDRERLGGAAAGRAVDITVGTQSPYGTATRSGGSGAGRRRVRIIVPPWAGPLAARTGPRSEPAGPGRASCRRPAGQMVWDREESFLAGVKPCRPGWNTAGGAIRRDLAGPGLSPDHGRRALRPPGRRNPGPGRGAYRRRVRIPHVRIEGRIAYTNNPMGGPFRASASPRPRRASSR